MTRHVWLMAGLLAALVAVADARFARGDDDADMKKTAKALVDKMLVATLKGEYETIIDLTHPSLFTLSCHSQ